MSHQIRMHADRLLPLELSDVDGNAESRRGTVSVFNGPMPAIEVFDTQDDEVEAVAEWIAKRLAGGTEPHGVAVLVRSADELARAGAAAELAGGQYRVVGELLETKRGSVSLMTMHLAKGLEFRAVAVMACGDEVIPLQGRIASITDESDLEEVYSTERHLLYVACTRARDELLVTGVAPGSEFLDDLGERGLSETGWGSGGAEIRTQDAPHGA